MKIKDFLRNLLRIYKKRVYPFTLFLAGIRKSVPKKNVINTLPVFGDKRLIVSLTSFPARIPYVVKSICSILNQSIKPNLVVLWLSDNQFPNHEKDLSVELLSLTNYGLTIEWVPGDIKSYKKLVPALLKYPQDIIITADDDLYYPYYWIERLVNSYEEAPNCIHTHCSTRADFLNGDIVFRGRYGECGDGSVSFNNKLLGGSGTLYPPGLLFSDVTNIDLFMSLAPTTDDIWFWAMALANNIKVRWIKKNMKCLYYVEGSQENSDCLTTVNDGSEKQLYIQSRRVFEKYGLFSKL